MFGLVPAIAVGTFFLKNLDPTLIKASTLGILAILVLLQGFGFRRKIHSNTVVGVLIGGGIGTLYSLTTISGPPLAILLNNEGFKKDDFKASLALIRVAESSLTAIMYYFLGFFTSESMDLVKIILPCALVAVPVGSAIIGRLNVTNFRRACISLDAWLIAFGLFKVVSRAALFSTPVALVFSAVIVSIDGVSVYHYFANRPKPESPKISANSDKLAS